MRKQTAAASMPALLATLAGLLLIGNWGCRSRSPVAKVASPVAGRAVAQGWASPWPADAPMSRAAAQAWVDDNVRRANYLLNSRLPYNEVQVPLIIGRDRRPYVQVSWGGRKIVCMLDTGTSEVIWPRWLGLHGRPLHLFSRTTDVMGAPLNGEWVLAPDISLGGFTVGDLATLAEEDSAPSPPAPHVLSMPVIGLQAFHGVIMTIDYRRKRLTIRDLNYFLNITHKPRRPHALLAEYPSYSSDQVVLPGTLDGHKAKFALDTGCAYNIIVGAAYSHKYLAVDPLWTDPRTGKIWYGSRHFAGTLLGRSFTLGGYVVPSTDPADALLGTGLFNTYRITIDQYRGIVLLEPN